MSWVWYKYVLYHVMGDSQLFIIKNYEKLFKNIPNLGIPQYLERKLRNNYLIFISVRKKNEQRGYVHNNRQKQPSKSYNKFFSSWRS